MAQERRAKVRELTRTRTELVQSRTELEARLLAYRCGWRKPDDIGVRKLERALGRILSELGNPDPAEALIRKRPRKET